LLTADHQDILLLVDGRPPFCQDLPLQLLQLLAVAGLAEDALELQFRRMAEDPRQQSQQDLRVFAHEELLNPRVITY
jgi:hypothetical protein